MNQRFSNIKCNSCLDTESPTWILVHILQIRSCYQKLYIRKEHHKYQQFHSKCTIWVEAVPKIQISRRSSLQLRAYEKAFYATNNELSSYLGYVILLRDNRNTSNMLYYSSRNLRLLSCSIVGAELYTLTAFFDDVAVMAAEILHIFDKSLLVQMLTDSKKPSTSSSLENNMP